MKTLKSAGGDVVVCSNVQIPEPGKPNRVGLVAQARKSRGWVELTPTEARELARDLERAADETEQETGDV